MACLAMLCALPATAEARVTISSGEAKLSLDRSLARQLERRGVDVVASGPGTATGSMIRLPVVAGATNGAPGRGALTVAGGFAFERGQRRARFTDLLLNTGKGQSTGRIAGARRILAKHGPLESVPAGFGTQIRIGNLALTKGTAAALNRKLGLRGVFRPGRRLGSLAIRANPSVVAIRSGSIELTGDPGFFGKLSSLGVAITPFEAATAFPTDPPSFSFPLLGGQLAPDGSTGSVGSETGLRLWNGPPPSSPVMSLMALAVSLESNLVLTVTSVHPPPADGGLYGTGPIADLEPDSATVRSFPGSGTIAIANLRPRINAFLAEKLNQTFAEPLGKSPTFFAGEPLGTLAISAQAR